MYVPPNYRNEDRAAVQAFLRAHAFGILITEVEQRSWGVHIPMELVMDDAGGEWLEGHVSRENPAALALAKAADSSAQLLAIFSGPHTYVSSSWYGQEEVSTWNYTAVHVYGRVEMQTPEELMAALTRLTHRYEDHRPSPRHIEDMSPRTLRQARGIVGFRLQIADVHAVHKLSQNRSDVDHTRIVDELSASGEAGAVAIASEMRAQRPR